MSNLPTAQMTEFEFDCWRCRSKFTVLADENDVRRRNNGELIQDCMSYLTIDERELFISSTCGECFDELYPPDYKEEVEDDN